MNKHAKKLLNFEAKVTSTGQTICHLLLQFAPFVHPKFLLKRKDFTKEIFNAKDNQGYSALLYLASKNSKPTIKKILASKNVREGHMLDLTIQEKGSGKSVLHYFAIHKDEEAMAAILDREELTPEAANLKDKDGKTPMVTCLLEGSPYMARDILEHSIAKDKFSLAGCHTQDGRSPLHLVAEQGNGSLWHIAVTRPDCDLNARDSGGNTPLMLATICKRVKMLEAWLKDKEGAQKVDMTLKNNEGKTLFMLFIEFLDMHMAKLLLRTVNLRQAVNEVNSDGHTALTAAVANSKWKVVEELLTNVNLQSPNEENELEGCVDVHIPNSSGLSALTSMLVAR